MQQQPRPVWGSKRIRGVWTITQQAPAPMVRR